MRIFRARAYDGAETFWTTVEEASKTLGVVDTVEVFGDFREIEEIREALYEEYRDGYDDASS